MRWIDTTKVKLLSELEPDNEAAQTAAHEIR